MKNFNRDNISLSLCGLNCRLCPMHLGTYCPGCGGGDGNQSCAIAKCSLQHDSVDYCCFCEEYPCEKYEHIDEYDSFITHRRQRKDLAKLKEVGPDTYQAEQDEKVKVLEILLEHYNDGRRKSFFCTAVNLLELPALQDTMNEITREAASAPSIKEKSRLAVRLLTETASRKGMILALNKKPSKK